MTITNPAILAVAFAFAGAVCSASSFGQERIQQRIFVRGYELLDKLAGSEGERAFARGYILSSLDVGGLCPPQNVNAFQLRDLIGGELARMPNDTLRLPAWMVVVSAHLDDWQCSPGNTHSSIGIRELLDGLRGHESNRQYAEGYVAGVLDNFATFGTCDFDVSFSFEPAPDLVAAYLLEQFAYAATNPLFAKHVDEIRPSVAIIRALAEAGLCPKGEKAN